jgi:glycosyltransferase involved in cell wall biosynthesis
MVRPVGLAGLRLRGKSGPQEVGRKLLVLDAAYSIRTMQERQLEQIVLARDLAGFFDHVWTLHPALGASPEHLESEAIGPRRVTRLNRSHTVIEVSVGRYATLRRLPALNFMLSQAAMVPHVARLIRGERISVLTAQDPLYLGLLALLLSRLSGVPFTVTIVANYEVVSQTFGPAYPRLFRWHFVERRVQRFVLRRAHSVAVGSADNLCYALRNGVTEDRVVDVGWGDQIQPVHFEDPSRRPPVRQELGLGDRPFLIFVSRLVPVKLPFDVLAVLHEARRFVPELGALVVGDGELRPIMEARARELGLEDDVVFAGIRPQSWIARALADAAVVVSPLTGRALIEAALSGTPIVAYDVEWQPEFITDGVTGVIVPYRDTAAMAAAVGRLVVDRREAASLGHQARSMALQLMDPASSMIDKQRQYEPLVASRSRRSGYWPSRPVLRG